MDVLPMAPVEASSLLPLVAILLPLLGVGLLVPLGRSSRAVRTGVLALLCSLTAGVSLALIPGALDGQVPSVHLLELLPGLFLHLRVDPMGALFGATVSSLWLLALIYSHGYLGESPRQGRYHAFFLLCLGFTLGVAYSGDLLTFLVFYELFSILTYPLVVHDETPEAMAAGRSYLAYIFLGGGLVTLGVVFTYVHSLTGLGFGQGPLLTGQTGSATLSLILAFFLLGFGVKAALFPLHGWVPQAHPTAPAPFSAILSGVMVAAGAFGIIRVLLEVFGPALLAGMGAMAWLLGAASFTVIFAGILAVREDHLKRRLAYSTVSQMAYVVLAASLLGAGATAGALVHMTHHAFMKGALFFCAGLLATGVGIRQVSQMGGAARKMPWTMAAFSVAALGLMGVPPLSGFVSKWIMGVGMVEAGEPFYLAVLLGGALLAALYLLPILYTAYVEADSTTQSERSATVRGSMLDPTAAVPSLRNVRSEAPATMLIPTMVAAGLTVLLGLGAFISGFPHDLARLAAEVVLGGGG
jgi:multicomponent Na+:H+ antiporter subunit D